MKKKILEFNTSNKMFFKLDFDRSCHAPSPIPGFMTMTGMLISSLNLILTRTNLTL